MSKKQLALFFALATASIPMYASTEGNDTTPMEQEKDEKIMCFAKDTGIGAACVIAGGGLQLIFQAIANGKKDGYRADWISKVVGKKGKYVGGFVFSALIFAGIAFLIEFIMTTLVNKEEGEEEKEFDFENLNFIRIARYFLYMSLTAFLIWLFQAWNIVEGDDDNTKIRTLYIKGKEAGIALNEDAKKGEKFLHYVFGYYWGSFLVSLIVVLISEGINFAMCSKCDENSEAMPADDQE